jgi:hypothetical protein
MAALYPWFVLAHVIGVVLFAVSHGVSAFVAFRVRPERDPHTVAVLLHLSRVATGPMYVGLLLIVLGGLGAAAAADLWFEPWIIASIGVLVVVLGVMYSVASPYYARVREAVGDPEGDPRAVTTGDELAALLDSRRPEVLVSVGSVGLVVLVWLMVVKPG